MRSRIFAAVLGVFLTATPAAAQSQFINLVFPPMTVMGNPTSQSSFGQAIPFAVLGQFVLATNPVVAVSGGGTGLTAGTSGGIPYFNSTSTMLSSNALAANVPVLGGGAGAAPFSGARSGNTTTFATTTGSLTSNNCVKIDASGNLIDSGAVCGGTVGIITIGTSTIASGTSGRVLYDNAGVVGEMTTSGSGTQLALTNSPTFVAQITSPLVIGGTGGTSTLTLESTSASGTTDSILFKTGVQVTAAAFETMPGSNTYTPVAGSVPGFYVARMGTGCVTTGIFTTPGIGPAPSSGMMWVCSDSADSTAGNISNIFAVAHNSGTRFTAAVSGIGVLRPGTTGGNAWGGQFSAIAQTTGAGIIQGANIEADWASGTVTGIAVTLKLGSSDGSTNTNNGNAYINSLADTGRAPVNGWRLQADNTNPIATTGNVIGITGANLSATNGVDLSGGTFSGCTFKGPNGTCISGAGGVQTKVTTVGGLPTCNAGAKGTRMFVTDANNPTYNTTVASGGAVNIGVTCDGTNWKT